MKVKRNDVAPRFRWISRKHNWNVTITEEGTDNFGTWWEEGSRRVLSYVNVKTGKIGAANSIPTAGPFGGGEVMDIPMVEGEMILEMGTFCGRAVSPTLYIHPDDVGFVVGRELIQE